MPVSTAITHFQTWRERQQARQDHEQLTTEEEEEAHAHPLQIPTGDDAAAEDDTPELSSPSSVDSTTPMVETVPADEGEDEDLEANAAAANVATSGATETTPAVQRNGSGRRTFNLADLEEERELARRRTSFCVLFAVFILFRLWIQAVATGDFFLLMMCLMGTSWTARFIRHTREREEELNRMISEYNDNGGATGGENNEDGAPPRDLQRISFQAQLAMAIINSQRDVMQGGYGNSDGGSDNAGVSDQAKEHWDRFQFQPDGKGYGSLSQIDDLELATKSPPSKEEDEPHCSICLGEYEEGDELVCLPCKHVYHEDCVGSWCQNHIRCPLCNFDLESASGDSSTIATASTTTPSS